MKFIQNVQLLLLFPIFASTLNRISKLVVGIFIDWVKRLRHVNKRWFLRIKRFKFRDNQGLLY